ncbi:MAG: PHP domain-containing protein [Armatimonadetes bacterium]|nr:PHP domain-containing protein [Candidatus Hippobium faecium]
MFELHIHTTESDGINTIDEMVEKAIELNYSAIGISDHITCNADGTPSYGHELLFKDLPVYFNKINSAKEKYKDKIKVLASVEIDYIKETYMTVLNTVRQYSPDYILAAIHGSCREMTAWDIPKYPELTDKFIRDCMQANIDLAKTGTVDILGHFDIFDIAIDIDQSLYFDLYDELAYIAKEKNICMELNMGQKFHPYMWQKCKELDIPVILATDAHSTSSLGQFNGMDTKIKEIGCRLYELKD